MPNTGADHIVTSYNEELLALAQAIAEMGGQVEVAIENGTRALLKLDRELADLTVIADQRIDDMQRHIDEMAVSMIARRQPMASDLRAIITDALKLKPESHHLAMGYSGPEAPITMSSIGG